MTHETFPLLKNINHSLNIELLKKDIFNINNTNQWSEWPEYNLWKSQENNNWSIFPLMVFGKWSTNNINLCPNTYEILKNIPNLVNVGFSRLSSGLKLTPHQGWGSLSNYILRCHLGIIIPGPAYIYCEEEKEKQEEGKWIIFDDSKIHSADNQSDKDRVVLILDIKRPNNIKKGESMIQDTDEFKSFIQLYQN